MRVNHSIIETLKLLSSARILLHFFNSLFELSLIMIQIYCSAIRKRAHKTLFNTFEWEWFFL